MWPHLRWFMAQCRSVLTGGSMSCTSPTAQTHPLRGSPRSASFNIPAVSSWTNVLFVLVCLLALIPYQGVDAVQGCSIFFQPDFKWKRAICDSDTSRLDRIPSDLPNILVELQVTHQQISVLGSDGLRDLVHLQTLAIESSGLRRVMLDAFHTLHNLTQLNLRNNSLQLGYNGLPAEVIRALPRLRMLNLAENPIDIVPDLFFIMPGSGVPSPLHRLWLGSTKSPSMHVERQAFTGLRYLRLLDLSYSKLATLPVTLASQFSLMLELKELFLGGNPWHCDCQLRWLRTWFVERHSRTPLTYLQKHVNRYGRQVTIEPICFSPDALRDRKLFGMDPVDTIDFAEFNCAPKLLTPHQNVSLMATKVNKLTCEFYADPKASVLWFRDGTLIKNDSHFSVVNQFVEETLISDLYAQFTHVGETMAISCRLDGYHEEVSATYHVTVIPYDSSLDDEQNGLVGGLESAGLSVTHQSWIYAGVGAGILFILLTSIGVGIFYCCDPRSHADQTFQRIVGKDQVNRLRSCYGCQKVPNTRVKQNGDDKGADASGVVRLTDTQSTTENETEGIELSRNKQYPRCTGTPASASSSATTTVSVLSAGRPNLTPLGGSLIRETVSTGENRLLVSCDGPEPTVLLATRFSAYNELSSPSSVYGMFDATKLSPSIKVTLPGSMGSYICSPSFSGQQQPHASAAASAGFSPDKTHIYASLSPVTNLHTLHKQTQPVGQSATQLIPVTKSPRYTTPCPVHGSIQLDHVDLSPPAAVESMVDQPDRRNSGTGSLIGRPGSGTGTTGKSKVHALPEHWYRSSMTPRSRVTITPSVVEDHSEEEDQAEEDDADRPEAGEEVEECEGDGEEDEEEEEDEDEGEDDDSGLLSHSTLVSPSNKTDMSAFRGTAVQFPALRPFKSRGGTTLHRPKSFTVLNSRMLGSKPRLIMPQSGSVHNMHPDRAGRCYVYPTNEVFSGRTTPSARRGLTAVPLVVPRISPRRPTTTRTPVPGGPPYKSCIRTSFSSDLDRAHDSSGNVLREQNVGSNPETSDETWNSNSESDTPTEETSSLTQAVEVMSNTERSTYEDNEFAHVPRHRSALRRRGSSSTLNFPTTGWAGYPPPVGSSPYPPPPLTMLPGSARSSHPGVGYRVATLPSRFRQSHSGGPGSGSASASVSRMRPTSGSYRDFTSTTFQRRASTQRSQTLVRPGSKHKLDTDSGTDNNDC